MKHRKWPAVENWSAKIADHHFISESPRISRPELDIPDVARRQLRTNRTAVVCEL